MTPTLNYAVACAGNAEAQRLLVAEIRQGMANIQLRVERLSKLATGRLERDEQSLRQTVQTREMLKVELERLLREADRFGEVLERLPRVNDARATQFEEDVHDSVVEMVKARWEYLRTGGLSERRTT